jgi:hypothetical protein
VDPGGRCSPAEEEIDGSEPSAAELEPFIYDADPGAGLAAMTPRIDTERDPVILAAMIENMLSDVERFQAEPLRALAAKLAVRVAEIPGNGFTDPEERASFLALFGGSP